MATTTSQLNATAVVTLNGAGAGTAKIGPVNGRETWQPAVASVKTNQTTATIVNQAQCLIYVGADASDSNYVDGTLSGSSGDSSANVAGGEVDCGEYVWAVWSGGDAGVQGRLNVQGTRTMAGVNRAG